MDHADELGGTRSALRPPQTDYADARWRAVDCLSMGKICPSDNRLLREPLQADWGAAPGLSFLCAHLNRTALERDAEVMHAVGPGTRAHGPVAAAWLEGVCGGTCPDGSRDPAGMKDPLRQLSLPGCVPGHVAPEAPGSDREGGKLGYAPSQAHRTAFGSPRLVAVAVGAGEAGTAPPAGRHSNKPVSPVRDGSTLPIMHLDGCKIASPTVLARVEPDETDGLLRRHGHAPHRVEDEDPGQMHRDSSRALDACLGEVQDFRRRACEDGRSERPRWPMTVVRSPAGWTGRAGVGGQKVDCSRRSNRVPSGVARENDSHRRVLEDWPRSYRPQKEPA